jgi:SAM-dependent methyltransferase
VRGLVGEVVGIDYDSEAAAFAARKCGCTTYSGELSESGLPEHSFDVICAMQVMEHVVDPIAFARMLAKYLAPGGIVYVEVPNLADPLLSLYAEPSYRPFYFHEAHVFYMSARALATIMLRAGFSGELHFLQEYNFLNHLHWVTRHGPQPSCHPGLQAPTVPTSEMLPEETRRQFEGWLKRTDREYKAFLVDHGLTDNVAFIGHIEQ